MEILLKINVCETEMERYLHIERERDRDVTNGITLLYEREIEILLE